MPYEKIPMKYEEKKPVGPKEHFELVKNMISAKHELKLISEHPETVIKKKVLGLIKTKVSTVKRTETPVILRVYGLSGRFHSVEGRMGFSPHYSTERGVAHIAARLPDELMTAKLHNLAEERHWHFGPADAADRLDISKALATHLQDLAEKEGPHDVSVFSFFMQQKGGDMPPLNFGPGELELHESQLTDLLRSQMPKNMASEAEVKFYHDKISDSFLGKAPDIHRTVAVVITKPLLPSK